MVVHSVLRGVARGATILANGYPPRGIPPRRVARVNPPRQVQMNNKALEQYYLKQLIEKGVLDHFYYNKIQRGEKLNSIMRNKMMEWKQKLGIYNNKSLQNKYGNLSSMNTLLRIRLAARNAKGVQNANKRKQNVTAYLKSLNKASLNAFLNQAGVNRGPKGPNGNIKSLLDQKTNTIISKLDEVLSLAKKLVIV